MNIAQPAGEDQPKYRINAGTMLRKPLFWGVLFVVFTVSAAFTIHYFPRVFPIVNISLKMNRQQALKNARIIAERDSWGPVPARQAASFDVDRETQDFIELEAGGKDAFARIIQQGLHSPYTWTVRHFKEGEALESSFVFTPEGKPYGFRISVPENEPGVNVSQGEARRIAEGSAVREWQVPIANYNLVEESDEMRINGRRDHVYVYERADAHIGEGTYRMRLTVSGNRLTELYRFIKIPEAFSRRFQEMRSANLTIAAAAEIAAGVIYVLGGCVVGLYVLMRKRWVIATTPLIVGCVVAGFQMLSEINGWPLEWMGYDTALSYGGFVFDHAIGVLYRFVIDAALVSLSFMAAETLSRKAFPEQIRLWRIWSKDAGSSVQVLGRTAGGYLLVAVFCAYQVLLYGITSRFHGWWTPSDALVDPNIFSVYFPWFTSFATALHAGFWEESLFRAVPIACGALIGGRYGKRGLGITAAIILQALIFGAAHANYPNEPSYARLVELILPSVGFGLLYLYFGLLPGIVLHFTFDAVWLSLPLFISSAQGSMANRILVVITVLFPLWIVLIRRLQTGGWSELPDSERNATWQPSVGQPRVPAARSYESLAMTKKAAVAIVTAGVLGIGIWFMTARFSSDVPVISIDRAEAVEAAKEELTKKNVTIEPPWEILTMVNGIPESADRFVWQTGGKKAYAELMDSGYLRPPQWLVRFARFNGDIVARAEEYHVVVSGKGKIFETSHQVPENRPGAVLGVNEARSLAESAIMRKYFVDISKLEEISATPSKLRERRSWEFVYSNPSEYPLKEGQARITVAIDGDEVTRISKSVYVPEQWERQERSKMNRLGIITSLSNIVTIVLFIAGLVVSIAGWARRRFEVHIFLKILVLLIVLELIRLVNGWHTISAFFSTSEPVPQQIFIAVGVSFLTALLMSLNVSIINGFISRWKRNSVQVSGWMPIVLGLAAGLAAAGVLAAARRVFPQYEPIWPRFIDANGIVPVIGPGIKAVIDFMKQTTLFLIIFTASDEMSNGWSTRKGTLAAIILLLGIAISGSRSIGSIGGWILSGTILAGAIMSGYVFVFRYYRCLVPIAMAGMFMPDLVCQGGYHAYPGAMKGYLVAILLIFATAYYWYQMLNSVEKREDPV